MANEFASLYRGTLYLFVCLAGSHDSSKMQYRNIYVESGDGLYRSTSPGTTSKRQIFSQKIIYFIKRGRIVEFGSNFVNLNIFRICKVGCKTAIIDTPYQVLSQQKQKNRFRLFSNYNQHKSTHSGVCPTKGTNFELP